MGTPPAVRQHSDSPRSWATVGKLFLYRTDVTSTTWHVGLTDERPSSVFWQVLADWHLGTRDVIAEHCSARRLDDRDRVRMRAAVLRLGTMLGWEPREIIAFTEALTNCSWRQCGCDEFEAVLEEYLAMGRVIQRKVARRRLRPQASISANQEEYDDARPE
jgi:hypothetical protein